MKIVVCCRKDQATLRVDDIGRAFACDRESTEAWTEWHRQLVGVSHPFLMMVHESDARMWTRFSRHLLANHCAGADWAAIRFSLGGAAALPEDTPHRNLAVLRSRLEDFLSAVQRTPTLAQFKQSVMQGSPQFSLLCQKIPDRQNHERQHRVAALRRWLKATEKGEPALPDAAQRSAMDALRWVIHTLDPDALRTPDALRLHQANIDHWLKRLEGHPTFFYID